MTTVSVNLSKFQYFVIDDLRAKGTFGTDDAAIVKGAFLAFCAENGVVAGGEAGAPKS